MEEEAEERDSREGLVTFDNPHPRRSKREKSARLTSGYNDELNDEVDVSSPNLKTGNIDMNHLDALSTLDPSSKLGENTSLIKDMRLAACAAAEEEVNKVYMCHLCDFKTAYANSLMNHQAVHSDYRPWACTACEYAAKRKQDLKKHLHTVHGMMVESPMLKPVLPQSPSGSKELGGFGDGTKEHFAESLNLKRSSSEDKDFSGLQPSSSSQGFPTVKRIKEEASNSLVLTSHSSERSIDRHNSIPGGELDSPDDNLPISFSTSSSAFIKTYDSRKDSASPTALPKYLPGREEGEIVFNSAHPNFSWHLNRREKYLGSTVNNNIPTDWSSQVIKKENDTQSHPHHHSVFDSRETGHLRNISLNNNDKIQTMSRRERENSLNHSFSLSDDDTRVSDDQSGADRIISSSSLIGQSRSTQTPSGFLCEHCDILFYQRAMYVMHIGLHAPDNPWCCSVCGNTFTEKYSFTSHFINQH